MAGKHDYDYYDRNSRRVVADDDYSTTYHQPTEQSSMMMRNNDLNIPMAQAISVDETWTPPPTPLAPPPAGTTTHTMPPSHSSSYDHPSPPPTTSTELPLLLPPSPPPPLSKSARTILQDQGYTIGLIDALERNRLAFPVRYWIVDNSGSMATADGHRIIMSSSSSSSSSSSNHPPTLKFAPCTRWKEMQDTVEYHTQLAAVLHCPTTYRLLNDPGVVVGPQTFRVAYPAHHHHHQHSHTNGGDAAAAAHSDTYSTMDHDLAVAQTVMMNAQPSGVTPLSQHVEAIRYEVQQMAPVLRQCGGKVAIVLATDGLPTDPRGYTNDTVRQEFVNALRSLEGLPVWIVVRLCTDADDVVQYWNSLDEQLELSLEVLDDFVAEAEEVHQHNKWLNYALPLHRMREMGFYHKLFDLLDERELARGDLKEFMKLLLGSGGTTTTTSGRWVGTETTAALVLPDPETDWKGFCDALTRWVAREKLQWNPITKRLEPWIDMKKLKQQYGGGGSFFGSFSFF